MKYKIITDVATEPVTLAEARLQCKVDSDNTAFDSLLTSLITAAREYGEHFTGRGFAPQTLEVAIDEFPDDEDDSIELPLSPVASITHIKYTDVNGTEQTVSSGDYALSLYGDARSVAPTYAKYWSVAREIPDAVRIRYVTGYTTLPKAAKQALLIHIELESAINPATPVQRDAMEKARDNLLSTIKIYGRTE